MKTLLVIVLSLVLGCSQERDEWIEDGEVTSPNLEKFDAELIGTVGEVESYIVVIEGERFLMVVLDGHREAGIALHKLREME